MLYLNTGRVDRISTMAVIIALRLMMRQLFLGIGTPGVTGNIRSNWSYLGGQLNSKHS